MLNGVSGMIGETAVVTKAVSDRHQPGSVFTRGEEWYAVSLFPGTTIDAGHHGGGGRRRARPAGGVPDRPSLTRTGVPDVRPRPAPLRSAYSGVQEVVLMIIGSVGASIGHGGGWLSPSSSSSWCS